MYKNVHHLIIPLLRTQQLFCKYKQIKNIQLLFLSHLAEKSAIRVAIQLHTYTVTDILHLRYLDWAKHKWKLISIGVHYSQNSTEVVVFILLQK